MLALDEGERKIKENLREMAEKCNIDKQTTGKGSHLYEKKVRALMSSVWGNGRKSEGGFIISTEKPWDKRPQ